MMSKKEKCDYYKEFIKITDCFVESANVLKDIAENFDMEKLNSDINKVHKLENDADTIVHKIRRYLIRDFLPPIDREDIALICNKLDDIEDGIDETLINMKILNIKNIKSDALELINILVKGCMAVKEVFNNIDNIKKSELILSKVIIINNLEDDGDRAYEKAIQNLYANEKDPIELIRWTNIYNCLEATIDTCEKIGDAVEDVVMKNT